ISVFVILDEDPVTRFTTPFGNPAFSHNSISLTAVSGLSPDGFIMTVQPAASAGPIFRVNIAAGKFHGVIAATTPTGFLQTCSRLPGTWVGMVSPYIRFPSSANHSMKEAAYATSPLDSLIVFPISSV